jgi:hypothetical protein
MAWCWAHCSFAAATQTKAGNAHLELIAMVKSFRSGLVNESRRGMALHALDGHQVPFPTEAGKGPPPSQLKKDKGHSHVIRFTTPFL